MKLLYPNYEVIILYLWSYYTLSMKVLYSTNEAIKLYLLKPLYSTYEAIVLYLWSYSTQRMKLCNSTYDANYTLPMKLFNSTNEAIWSSTYEAIKLY